MKSDTYLECIEERLRRHFEIQKNHFVAGERFPLVASYHNQCGRSFISKVDIIDTYSTAEHCFIKVVKEGNMKSLIAFEAFLKNQLQQITPTKDHMYTQITGVFIADILGEISEKQVKKFQYQKVFAWYFRGWGDVKLYVVDLERNQVLANRSGQKQKYVYQLPKS